MVKIDVRNAFNSLRRDHMLRVLKSRVPSAYPLASQAYSSPSHLLFGETFIESATGLQQGDPLGPLAFALSVDEIARSITSPFNIWYLDDATIAGSTTSVLSDLKRIIPDLEKIGLEVNSSKCEITNLGCDQSVFQNFLGQVSGILQSVAVTPPSELQLLGSPILPASLKVALCSKKSELVRMISRLQLIDAHPAFFLLKNCLAVPKLIYILRASPMYKLQQELSEFDATIREAVTAISNVEFEQTAWNQATLPVRFGGLGVRLPSEIALPAYLSSLSTNKDLVNRILDKTDESLPDFVEASSLWTSLGHNLPDNTNSQSEWDHIRCQELHNRLKQDLDQSRLACVEGASMPQSGAWLNSIPNPAIGTYLDDETLRISIALRVGAKVCEQHPCKCGLIVDSRGHHPLSCKKSAGRFPRHAALNNVFKRALDRLGIPSVLEPVGLDRGDGKRPDGLTSFPFSMGKSLAWDATCCDTFAETALNESAVNPGSAARKAENRKIEKYSSLTDRYIFEPLAFETSGAIGPRTHETLKKLGDRIARKNSDPREVAWLFQRFSFSIIRGDALSILQANVGVQ